MRGVAVVLCVVSVGYGGCGGAGNGDSASFVQITGIEGKDVHGFVKTPDGLAVQNGGPNGQPMIVRGSRITPLAAAAGASSLVAARDGTLYFATGDTSVYRVDGTSKVTEATLPIEVIDLHVDGAGGLYAYQNPGFVYRAPGAQTFEPVEMAPLTHLSFASRVRAADGSIYASNTVVQQQTIVRLSDGVATTPIDCNIQELSFCAAEMRFTTTDNDLEPMFWSGEFYRISGSTMTQFAPRLTEYTYILGIARRSNSELYVSAAVDNLAASEAHLFRFDGQDWIDLGLMPGRGGLAVGGDGTLYTNPTVIGGPGGLWIVEL